MSMLNIQKRLDRINKTRLAKVNENCCKDGSCSKHNKKLGESAKTAEYELKQLIREALREAIELN